jgi:methyl-coenzyme M reductase subunit C
MPIDRETQVVDCRESMGLDKGGGLAQRGTLSETGRPDVVAIAMTPGKRHITKPVCEITHGLRREGIQVSVLVLYSGGGVPSDAKDAAIGHGPKFGMTEKEIEQINRHKLALIHLGNIKSHVIYKTRDILRFVKIPAIVVCQTPVDFEDFARIGVKTRVVMPGEDKIETQGSVVEIVTGITRGQTCARDKLNEIVKDIIRINPQKLTSN